MELMPAPKLECTPSPTMGCQEKPKLEMQNTYIGLTIDFGKPTAPKKPQKKEEVQQPKTLSEKLLAIMRKYKFSWRTLQLSKPRFVVQKYVSEPDLRKTKSVPLTKTQSLMTYRQEDMAIPDMRRLVWSKKYWGKFMGKKYRKTMNSHIKRAWNSMYNYYRRAERDKKKRKRRTFQTQKKKKDPKEVEKQEAKRKEFYNNLSTPKKRAKPDPLPKKKIVKIEDIRVHIDELSQPKPDLTIPPRPVPFPISRGALLYKMTPPCIRLATSIPKRFREKPWEPLPPGGVKKSALTYKITEKIANMAIPKKQVLGKESDLKEDAFVISPNALKYKPTARIIELARPKGS